MYFSAILSCALLQDVNLQHLVRKILVNKLKQQRLEAAPCNNVTSDQFAVDSTLPTPAPAAAVIASDVAIDFSENDAAVSFAASVPSESDDSNTFEFDDEEGSEESGEDDDIDLKVLQTMPRDMQIKRAGEVLLNGVCKRIGFNAVMFLCWDSDVILAERLSRSLRERHRDALIGVQDDPEAFSLRQMDHFIKQANITQTVRYWCCCL
jgi:hypothetical protein